MAIMEKEQRQSVLFVFVASLLFSVGGLCVKLIPWNALAINGMRNLLGTFVIGTYLWVSHHRLVVNKKVLLGALSVAGTTTLFTIANKLTTAGSAIVLQFTAPAFVILFSFLLLHTKPERLDVVTCVLVLFGVALFFIDGLREGKLGGNIVAVLAGVCYAGVFMMNSTKESDALSSVFIGQLACGVVFTPFCLKETNFSLTPMVAMLVLGVFQVGLAYTLLSLGIRRTPPIMASLITGLEPVLNPIWVAIFYKETLSATALVGAALVVGSIVCYNVLKARKSAVSKQG